MTRRQPDDALMERISSAMDADGGVDGDAELRALLDRDPDALLYAQDLVRIDEVLADLGKRAREPDWDALAARIEASLDREDEGEPLAGFDAPPRFLDAGETAPHDAAPPDAAPRDANASQEVPIAVTPSAKPDVKDAKVVDLASRRRSTIFAWTGGLAAAAAVGLGIVFGTTSFGTSFDAAPSSESAAYEMAEDEAPMAQAVAPAPPPAMPAPAEAPAWDGLAEGEAAPELPAAAVAIGRARGAAGGGGAPPPSPMAAPRLDDRMERARAAEPASIAAPGRADVLTTLRDVEPAVQRCLARAGETARVTMQVGVAGNIVSARVDPPYTGADAACIVDAVRGAHLPPSPEGYVFVHVFRPAPIAGGSLARPPNASRAARRMPARPAARAESAGSAGGTEVIDAFE